MRVITLLGAVVALALGSTSCTGSSDTRARGETVGGEARHDEAHPEADREGKGKMEAREPTEVREAEEEAQEAEEEAQEAEEEAQEDRTPRRVPDNPWYRQYNVLDQPNPTNP
jgi:hypothetical protein